MARLSSGAPLDDDEEDGAGDVDPDEDDVDPDGDELKDDEVRAAETGDAAVTASDFVK